ncbi:MAG TPA: mannosyltransferase family protein, partial [Anaerolineaceae bacterium]
MEIVQNPSRGKLFFAHHFTFKREWLFVLLIFLFMRAVLAAVPLVTLWQTGPVVPPWMNPSRIGYQGMVETLSIANPVLKLFVSSWYRWDTGWFIQIAESGYSAANGTMSFMPLYPLLILGVHALLGGNALVSALLVSNIFCAVALILFYEAARLELGADRLARQSLLYLVTFPSAFFLFAGYSESLFLTCVLAAWLLARRGDWHWAALSSALAVLTRLQGLALVVPLGWQLLASRAAGGSENPLEEFRSVFAFIFRERGWLQLLRDWKRPAWIGALFPLIALALYSAGTTIVGLNSVLSGYASRDSSLAYPWQGLVEFFSRIFSQQFQYADAIDLAVFILFFGALIYGIRKLRPALTLFSAAL